MKNALAKITVVVIFFAIAFSALAVLPEPQSAQAQGTNLIGNPQMNVPYYGIGAKGQVPSSWTAWANGEAPVSDYHQFVEEYRSAPSSWVQRCAYLTCTAGGYQTVGVEQGKMYRFTIYAFLWTCKNENPGDPCRDADGRWADQDSGAKVRVGFDPTGGTDPNSANVLWGGYSQPWVAYGAVSADITAESNNITVFTYWTQSVSMQFNEVYWDDASLVEISEGAPLNGGVTEDGTEVPPPPAYVPFVDPQSARPDGSIVHVVGDGDTFSSIYVAYRDYVTRDQILEYNGWDLPPAIITLGQEIIILPAGSVDPTTGQLINAPNTNTSAPTPVPPPTQQADTTVNPTPLPPPVNNGSASTSGGVGPSTPDWSNADVEKGGSLLPGASSHFFSKAHHMTSTHHPGRTRLRQTTGGRVCVQFFEDKNTDLWPNTDESPVESGSFTLDKLDYTIDSPDGMLCVDNVTSGLQTIEATAPSGYGFIASPRVQVNVYPQREILVQFGVVQGASIPDTPPEVDEPPLDSYDIVPVATTATATTTEDDALVENLFNNYAAYGMFALAGLIGLLSIVVVWSYRR